MAVQMTPEALMEALSDDLNEPHVCITIDMQEVGSWAVLAVEGPYPDKMAAAHAAAVITGDLTTTGFDHHEVVIRPLLPPNAHTALNLKGSRG